MLQVYALTSKKNQQRLVVYCMTEVPFRGNGNYYCSLFHTPREAAGPKLTVPSTKVMPSPVGTGEGKNGKAGVGNLYNQKGSYIGIEIFNANLIIIPLNKM